MVIMTAPGGYAGCETRGPCRRDDAPSFRRPVGRLATGGFQVGVDPGRDLRMLRGDVGRLGDVILQVVERQRRRQAAFADALPAPLVQGSLAEAALVEFPVEELMLLLRRRPAQE